MKKYRFSISLFLFLSLPLFAQSVDIKDGTSNTLLKINDEGNAGSVILPPLSSITDPAGKLYNLGSVLYWGSTALGSSGSAGGWTSTTGKVYNTTLTDKVGIGTNNPLSVLHLRTQDNWRPSSGNGWGDFSISDGTKGLAIGMAEFGGGAGDIRIWAKGGTERIMIGDATNGDILTTVDGKVGIGVSSPEATLDIRSSGIDVGAQIQIGNSDRSHFLTLFPGRENDPEPFIAWKDSDPLRFVTFSDATYSGYNEIMKIEATTGNVALGSVTSSGYKLKVTSSTGAGINGIGNFGHGIVGVSYLSGWSGIVGRGGVSGALAGWFIGDVNIDGTLSKGAGSFKIDHPLDPTNKNLYHSFVESPDMMNIYNGNVELDANGEAMVVMADWFEALNMEFRYQLTCIGGFAPVYIAEELSDNQFKIAGGTSGMKISWQVTGIRHDAFANANRIQVEEIKDERERGKYLHPKAFNLPKTLGVSYDPELEADRASSEN